jgi:hypothetical protein
MTPSPRRAIDLAGHLVGPGAELRQGVVHPPGHLLAAGGRVGPQLVTEGRDRGRVLVIEVMYTAEQACLKGVRR